MINVSIITVCFNSEKTISKTIESVLNQSYENIEYIIIDGASTDGTLAIVNQYRDSFKERLKVISEPDEGIYYAMNKGIELASGEIIGIINSDDRYEIDAVERVVDAYEEEGEPDYAVIFGNLRSWSENGELVGESQSRLEGMSEKMTIAHPSTFVSRSTYREFGAFNTKYVSVADYDLIWRYSEESQIRFIKVDSVLANFTLGGMCSSRKAGFDLYQLKKDRGQLTAHQVRVLKFKAYVSSLILKIFHIDITKAK